MAIESIQLALLRELFNVNYFDASFSFGFSLGEIGAVIAGGVFDLNSALEVLLPLADDCVALARDATLGVLFTRSRELALDDIRRLCLEVNQEGRGVVGISAQLARTRCSSLANKIRSIVLWLGPKTRSTYTFIFARTITAGLRSTRRSCGKSKSPTGPPSGCTPCRSFMQRRAARLFAGHRQLRLHAGQTPANCSANGSTIHSDSGMPFMKRWFPASQPCYTSALGRTLFLLRLSVYSANVISQTQESRSLRALSAAVRRLWLRRLLPHRAALLRAPFIKHVILEDWLLDNSPR